MGFHYWADVKEAGSRNLTLVPRLARIALWFSSVCSKQSGKSTAGQGNIENLGHASLPREKASFLHRFFCLFI
jgi:hypothetical protein